MNIGYQNEYASTCKLLISANPNPNPNSNRKRICVNV